MIDALLSNAIGPTSGKAGEIGGISLLAGQTATTRPPTLAFLWKDHY